MLGKKKLLQPKIAAWCGACEGADRERECPGAGAAWWDRMDLQTRLPSPSLRSSGAFPLHLEHVAQLLPSSLAAGCWANLEKPEKTLKPPSPRLSTDVSSGLPELEPARVQALSLHLFVTGFIPPDLIPLHAPLVQL